jgi:hypothetical protein
MGASSSSAFWEDINYNHGLKKIGCIYKRKSNLETTFIPEEKDFFIQDALQLLSHSNLFPDITLILDIDFTLGQASEIMKTTDGNYLLNRTLTSAEHIERLVKNGKATWFHDGNVFFFIRPYFAEFISFCDRNFKEVIIWTNGVQKHADSMLDLVERTIGKRWIGYGRSNFYSTGDTKIVSKIGLDPNKTWMVDDDHVHYNQENTNIGIKFFHAPEFSMEWFRDLHLQIPKWGKETETYDDWFLFLIWNWVHMKNEGIEMVYYDKRNNILTYEKTP